MTANFSNDGFGWTCRRCAGQTNSSAPPDESLPDRNNAGTLARFFTEGEAEERDTPALAAPALARWRDSSQRTLVCPRCGVEEEVREEESRRDEEPRSGGS